MSKIIAAGQFDEMWGASFREQGFEFCQVPGIENLSGQSGDFYLLDLRHLNAEQVSHLQIPRERPVLTMIPEDSDRGFLKKLRSMGMAGYVGPNIPASEVAVRLRSLKAHLASDDVVESRRGKRIWYQTEVDFQVFDKKYKAWSTTLSETGIFLRTDRSFPLHSPVKVGFSLLGEKNRFEADGVVVREETDENLRGFAVMFQNLRGENIRILESFLDLYR